jgi:ABC-type multidrug transport system ATPase subunit
VQFEEFVEETMRIVELDTIAHQIVGIPGLYGLSGEQFKRLTIAVELVSNPSIIFCDEPTSGLDACAAQIVMRVVRKIVDNNRTIVCTIHQPSAEIFLHFDELLLLKRGGWTIYYGPLGHHSQSLVDYFESVDGAKKLQQGYNPATYMLEARPLHMHADLLGLVCAGPVCVCPVYI